MSDAHVAAFAAALLAHLGAAWYCSVAFGWSLVDSARRFSIALTVAAVAVFVTAGGASASSIVGALALGAIAAGGIVVCGSVLAFLADRRDRNVRR